MLDEREERLPTHALATLRHRDFRLLWGGQLVSIVGDQMQSIGISWQLYLLTNSPLQLGLLGLFRAVPFMALSLAGGALADTFDRKRLLIVTQTSQMLLTTLLVAATASGHVAPWLLYGVTFLSGAATAFDAPARQAMIPSLVSRQELPAALTLTMIQRRTAMILGPGIGGLVIARFGLAANYSGNALSFLAVVAVVLMLGDLPRTARIATNNWDRLLGGVRFSRREPLVLLPMLLDFSTRVFCASSALLPIFARDIFATGAEGLGWLSAAMSAGAVVGGLVLGSSHGLVKRPIALMLAAYAAEGLLLAGFGVSGVFALGLLMMFLKGIANIIGEVLRTTVLQLKTPDDVRGRVTALSGMFDSGGPLLGQLESGLAASLIGPVAAAVSGGVIAGAVSAGFAALPGLRRSLWTRSEDMADVASGARPD
ncbi:MAG: MFS transporter [Chloroflexota bacterium]